MHWSSRHLFITCHTQRKKMHIHPRKHARVTVQQLLRHANHCNQSWNLSSAQETIRIHASPLRSRGRTGTIRSSALVRAPSRLSMVRSRAWLRTWASTSFYFHLFFAGFAFGIARFAPTQYLLVLPPCISELVPLLHIDCCTSYSPVSAHNLPSRSVTANHCTQMLGICVYVGTTSFTTLFKMTPYQENGRTNIVLCVPPCLFLSPSLPYPPVAES